MKKGNNESIDEIILLSKIIKFYYSQWLKIFKTHNLFV